MSIEAIHEQSVRPEAAKNEGTEEGVSAGARWKATTAAALGVGAAAALAGCPPPGYIPGDPYPDVTPPTLPENLRRLVSRTTFGINAREAELALSLGYDGYLEYHLAHESIDDTDLDAQLAALRTLDDSPYDRVRAIQRDDDTPIREFFLATVLRAAYTRRQLYERMVEFWSDHFNIFFRSEAQEVLKPVDDLEVIRPHALGQFPELLRASAHSPAMLLYLDNTSNRAEAPNQNYARELMELHTLGVDNYTQRDIEEVSRAFTGWSAEPDRDSVSLGRFRFWPQLHDYEAKHVLGHDLLAGQGIEDGEDVLDLLCLDSEIAPITAHFLAHKIAVRFWGEEPPPALVGEIADAYLNTQGDIRAMVRAALSEDWLMQAPAKIKRPSHFTISALRVRPSLVHEIDTLGFLLHQMGHVPFHWPTPDGYPDENNYWGENLMPRWTYGTWLVAQRGEISIDFAKFIEAPTDADFLDLVAAYYFAGATPLAHRDALASFLAAFPNNPQRRREALALAIGSADFQWF
ncbi:MAG: DUF1800 family protein [Nitrospiraceae bacterium]|nr:DUF1800 family protein [Nitrospiraceae bacterium]